VQSTTSSNEEKSLSKVVKEAKKSSIRISEFTKPLLVNTLAFLSKVFIEILPTINLKMLNLLYLKSLEF
jgi:hypothetical protein